MTRLAWFSEYIPPRIVIDLNAEIFQADPAFYVTLSSSYGLTPDVLYKIHNELALIGVCRSNGPVTPEELAKMFC